MSHKRKIIEIDAAGMAPGRLATQIAVALMGKNKADYAPHVDAGDKVRVKNVELLRFTGKKLSQKLYRHHSNYPGGLKEVPAKKMMAERPQEVLRRAVIKMLPKNKLRDQRMIRLTFVK